MTAARNAKPVPASITVSVFASAVRGTTSPRPSVKNVVPLMYTSDQNPDAPPPATVIAEPAAHCSSRSEEHTSELQSLAYLVCRLLLEKKKSSPQRLTRRCSTTTLS